MFERKSAQSRTRLIFAAVLLAILFFFGCGFTLTATVFLLMDGDLGSGRLASLRAPSPQTNPTLNATPRPLVTPIAAPMTPFRSVALGFAVDYPNDWRKRETALKVIFSPSADGLDPKNLQDVAVWVGIPADNSFEPAELLTHIIDDFPDNAQPLNISTMNIASQTWTSMRISFEDENLGGPVIATGAATSHNEVGYVIVAIAPAAQWSSLEPIFQGMVDSFRFTEQIVIRPTEATPPPTPTPTPTPRIYVVQAGDTLLQIAIEYDVTVEALAARNGIDDPRNLRTGQRLIIPTKR